MNGWTNIYIHSSISIWFSCCLLCFFLHSISVFFFSFISMVFAFFFLYFFLALSQIILLLSLACCLVIFVHSDLTVCSLQLVSLDSCIYFVYALNIPLIKCWIAFQDLSPVGNLLNYA